MIAHEIFSSAISVIVIAHEIFSTAYKLIDMYFCFYTSDRYNLIKMKRREKNKKYEIN